MSPPDRIMVGTRAFQGEVQVLVKLDVLGLDSTMWGDLQHFRGLVVDRYYQEVHGQPMFTVDFGGSVGLREVLVTDTELDRGATGCHGSTVRVLDFSEPASPLQETGNAAARIFNIPCSPNRVQMCSMVDDPSDAEWQATWEDFADVETSEISSPHSGSFCEMPLQQLGLYDSGEDTSGWSFSKTWADDQWQETEFTLLGDRCTFTGGCILLTEF